MSSLPERTTRSGTDPAGARSPLPLLLVATGLAAAALVAVLEASGSVRGAARVLLEAIALPAFCAPWFAWGILRPYRRRIAGQFAPAREVNRALESSEARQRAVSPAAPDPIRVVDVRDVSPAPLVERELKRQLAQLRALHRLGDALAHGASVARICEEAVEGVCEALEADRAALLLTDEDGEMRYRASRGLSDAYRAAMLERKPWENLVPGGDHLSMPDVESIPEAVGVRDVFEAEGMRASLLHCIRYEGRRQGLLVAYWNAPHPTSEEEIRLGTTIAHTVGFVLHRARQQAEQDRLAMAVDATQDAVVLTDANGVIRRVNRAFTRITGWEAWDVVGKSPRILRSRHTPAEVHREMWRTIRSGQTWSGRLVDVRRDGAEYHAALSISPVYDDALKITGYVGVQRDVSLEIAREETLRRTAGQLEATNRELRAAKETAESAARAKSEFLAAMSHEIRTPMNGVLGFTHLLADTALDPRQREYVSIIQGSGQALLAIIDDILDLSKIEADRLELEPRPYDLRRAAREVAGLLGPQADQKGLGLAWTADDDVPDVLLGDEGRVRQVLTNLLGNAIKFTEAGSVRLHLARETATDAPGFVRVSVEDTGIGIAAGQLGLLFQNFSQVDRSMSRRFGGTGLGLAISRRLVGMMGGRIGVESEPGRGSTFWFTLPVPAGTLRLPEESPAGAAEFALVRSREDAPPLRVLVADDNSVNQLLARSLLERLGCRVDVAANGIEAVEMVRRIGYDLVFMDFQMPEMDGFEATRAIRAAGEGRPRVPIVALTASALPEDRERALGAGMDDFLPKPLVPVDLARCVARWAA